MNAEAKIDPLLAGFYSYSEVAKLLRLKNTQRIRGWVQGWAQSASPPIIDRDFEGGSTVSFLDLIEIRFVDCFRRQGVSAQTLRIAAQKARENWNTTHPFASEYSKYYTDRVAIFEQVAHETKDNITIELVSGQHQMWYVIEETIAKDVEFDPNSYLAKFWRPSKEFPDVVLDPRVSFGQPSLEGVGVPTSAIYKLWKAEGNISRVANWFEIDEALAKQAIQFEVTMEG